MFARIIRIGMTRGAIRLIGRRRPWDNLIVRCMAVKTGQPSRPVIWIISGRMIIISESPIYGRMTFITFQCCDKMIDPFAGCRNPIMTCRTATQNLIMVNVRNRCPGDGRVTILTDIGGQNMGRVLTCGNHTIMTTGATAQYLIMIHINRGPVCRYMAILTDIG